MTAGDAALAALAAAVAGAINAVAGGGSLITFPVLVALGLPSVEASLTNTIALCPGWFAAVYVQRAELRHQRKRVAWLVPAAAAGGVAGAWLLLESGARAFDVIVPFLIVFAAAMLAAADHIKGWVGSPGGSGRVATWALPVVFVGGVYGGYFGAALGVIFLAVLALAVDDTLVAINALKQTVSLSCNAAAAIVFVAIVGGDVEWLLVAAMAVGAVVGGGVGGRFARRLPARVLRTIVIIVAVAVAGRYWLG